MTLFSLLYHTGVPSLRMGRMLSRQAG